MSAVISVDDLGKRFAHRDHGGAKTLHQFVESGWRRRPKVDFWALRNVSFSVDEGEMLGVIGGNGSGKSTLLRLLGGLMMPSEGRVTTRARVSGLLDLNAGMHPDLTGRENAIGSGIIAGLSRREILDCMDEVIAFAELEDFIDEPVRTYSAGMRLRLGFAVAAQTQPRILLIDEVLAVGDIGFQRKCLEKISQFRSLGCAIILISHDLAQVDSMCDRVLWLKNGKTAGLGATHGIVSLFQSEMLQMTAAMTPDADPEGDAGGASHLRLNHNRFGTLENRITRLRFLDSTGAEKTTIRSEDPFSLQIWVDSIIPMTELNISVTIANEKGVDIVDLGTTHESMAMPARTGTAVFQVDIGGLPLAGGRYVVSLGLYEKDWVYAYDRHVAAYDFTVEGEESWAPLAPPHRWSMLDPLI